MFSEWRDIMKPRIFISSTFYDLKYIREDLANFIRSYGYEPVLFEDGDIGYTPGKELDKSCYDAMKNSDMVILIIGGEYGSAASGEKKDAFNEYMSVTRNEFRTAIAAGVPVFVMIDKKVMVEYGVYEANLDSIEGENIEIKFTTTKSINVFRFIKEVKSIVILPVQEFEKSSDIKNFIGKQWADMFKNYLDSLRSEKENRKIENSVNEMKDLIQKMNIMIDSVGKNVLTKENPSGYESVINQQEISLFCNNLTDAYTLSIHNGINVDSHKDKEKVMSTFFSVLQVIREKNIYQDENTPNTEKVRNLIGIFSDFGFSLEQISLSRGRKLEENLDLLSNEKKREKVMEVMMTDEYFRKLFAKM